MRRLADLACRGGHHAHRAERPARQPVAEPTGPSHQDGDHGSQQDANPEQRLLELVDRPAQHQRPPRPSGQVDRNREDPRRVPGKHLSLAAASSRADLPSAGRSQGRRVADLPGLAENSPVRREQERTDCYPGVRLPGQRLGGVTGLQAGVLLDLRLDQMALGNQAGVHGLVLGRPESEPEAGRGEHGNHGERAEVDESQADSGPPELLAHPGLGSNL